MRARGPGGIYDWSAPDGTRLIYCCVGYGYGRAEEATIKELAGDVAAGKMILPYYVMRGGYSDLEMPDGQIVGDIEKFKEMYPCLDFEISSPTPVIKHYLNDPESMKNVPKISGEWPVGWGSASAGFVKSFQKDLYLENYLLAAEKITVISKLYGGTLNINIKEARWETVFKHLSWGERGICKIDEGSEFDEMWKALLYNHDHNFGGTGGAKSETDREVMKIYCEEYANEIVGGAMSYIEKQIAVPICIKSRNPIAHITIFNQMAWNRNAIITASLSNIKSIPENFDLLDAGGNEIMYETKNGDMTFMPENLPSLGFKKYYIVEKNVSIDKPEKSEHKAQWFNETYQNGAYILETPFYKISVEEKTGNFLSIYDRGLKKELIQNNKEKKFGEIVSYEESGSDVIYNFTGKKTLESSANDTINIIKSKFSIKLEKMSEIIDSKVVKRYTFYKNRPEINIKITIFWWGELNQHIRLQLPFSPKNFCSTRYGVPFYSMEWPKMMNGVEDETILGVGEKFRGDEIDANSRLHIREVCKWIDVGYESYGVAIGMKTSGAYIDNNHIEPLILRTGRSCGDWHVKVANAGKQELEYTILPHSGDWKEAKIYRFGWENANAPICRIADAIDGLGIIKDGEEQFSTDKSNIIITTLKPAYDHADAFSLRFFETEGLDENVVLRCPGNIVMAKDVNMLEQEKCALKFSGREVTVPIKPYQITSTVFYDRFSTNVLRKQDEH